MSSVFVSDCEGPISKNDNAFEVTSHFVPHGDRLFTAISRYDDVAADIMHRPSYDAGNTLKLIVPFLCAFEVTNRKIAHLSEHTLLCIRDSAETLRYIRTIAPSFIVSASYEHYMKALCCALDFPLQNAYCTRVDLDAYHLSESERTRVKEIAAEITHMQIIDITPGATMPEELSPEARSTIAKMDELFREISEMQVGKAYIDVNPIGGRGKCAAIQDIASKTKIPTANSMYVGDSITDVDAFGLVRDKDGLTISFNGNQYAVKAAEIAVMSDSNVILAVLSDIFARFGKRKTLKLVNEWGREELANSGVDSVLAERLLTRSEQDFPKVKIITNKNMGDLIAESTIFRKSVRGEAVGGLG